MHEPTVNRPVFALRPIVERRGDAPVAESVALGGGPLRFSRVEVALRPRPDQPTTRFFASAVAPQPIRDALEAAGLEPNRADEALARASATPAPIAGLRFDRPRIMAVLNVTPDSFSDGGVHFEPVRAVEAALEMVESGADIIDIGAESTRPGADDVDPREEWDRLAPVLEGLRAAGCDAPISIDTRKIGVARAAYDLGARLWNDVSALRYEPGAMAAGASLSAAAPGAGVCLMHAQGAPKTMQKDPTYQDPVLDVLSFLEERMEAFISAGGDRSAILLDPGIGFGKTLEHNIALLRATSVFVATGRPVLVGVSRKRMIGTLGQEPDAARRGPGSVAAALAALAKGARVLRMHDVEISVQAVRVWREIVEGDD